MSWTEITLVLTCSTDLPIAYSVMDPVYDETSEGHGLKISLTDSSQTYMILINYGGQSPGRVTYTIRQR